MQRYWSDHCLHLIVGHHHREMHDGYGLLLASKLARGITIVEREPRCGLPFKELINYSQAILIIEPSVIWQKLESIQSYVHSCE